MKKATVMLMAMLLLLGGLSLKAQITETNSFTNLNEAIPDGNASGLHDVRAISSAIPHLSSVLFVFFSIVPICSAFHY